MVDCISQVCCIRHGKPCRVETNKYGCVDYVCNVKDQCNFRKPYKQVAERNCLKHPQSLIAYELFTFKRPGSTGSKRCYYRCNRDHVDNDPWWCGYEDIIEIGKKVVAPQRNDVLPGPKTNVAFKEIVKSETSGTVLNIRALEQELETKRKLLMSVNMSILPDGGSRIKCRIDELVSTISKLKLNTTSGQSTVVPQKVIQTTNQPSTAWPTQKSAFYDGVQTTDMRRDILTTAIEQIHSAMESKPMATDATEDPIHLTIPLMNHQKTALSWLLWREKQNPSGGIIADDMGLGKTLTMIALILKSRQLAAENKSTASAKLQAEWIAKLGIGNLIESKTTLVICPASLLHHWESEVNKRCVAPCIKLILFHGSNRQKITVSRILECDIIVTTYDTVRSELSTSKSANSVLKRIAFDRIILDEGHVIKNPKCNTSMSVCHVFARSRWVVTGTPIHNNLTDMYSLLKFLRCSPFDDSKMWKYWVDNRKLQGQQRLATIVSCLLLRRTKNDVGLNGEPLVSLPAKTVQDIKLCLNKEENDVYVLMFDRSKAMLESYLKCNASNVDHQLPISSTVLNNQSTKELKLVAKVGVTGSGQGEMVRILVQLLRLRQCCCHLGLLRETLEVSGSNDHGDGNDNKINRDCGDPFDDLADQMRGMNMKESPDDLNNVLADAKLIDPITKQLGSAFEKSHSSTKIKALLAKLKEFCDENTAHIKSVVVSQWTSMLDIVSFHLKEAGISFCEISGKIPIKLRNKAIEDFNGNSRNGPQVMLLSLKAGGVGLNLIGGSRLFFMDIHWNPALENQAADRIHRMGQLKDVYIYRFICDNTIEMKIVALQQSKLSLADSVVQGGGAIAKSHLSLKDLKHLFGMI